MKFQKLSSKILGEIGNVLSRVNEKQVQDFVNIIIESKRIFVVGPGKYTVPSVQPMGSLFEQSLFILHDLIVLRLMERMGTTASQMAKRHRNVE